MGKPRMWSGSYVKTDNTKTLYNALDKIEELEKEKCELLGLIQAKDELIEKMKRCYNCKFNLKFVDVPCDDCDNYSKWELVE